MFDFMRKPSTPWVALGVAALGLLAGQFLAHLPRAAASAMLLTNSSFEDGLAGWSAPNQGTYEFSVDSAVVHDGQASASLTARTLSPQSTGILSQALSAETLRGKRVRVTGYLRGQSVEWVALFVHMRGSQGENLGDQPMPAPIKGTTAWQRAVVVVDVPANAASLSVGVQLAFQGQVWLDDVQLDIVGSDVPLSKDLPPGNDLAAAAINLHFEAGLEPWGLDAMQPSLYEVGTQASLSPDRHAIAFLRSRPDATSYDAANLTEWFRAKLYRAKQMRFSVLVKTDSVPEGAGLFMVSDDFNPSLPGPDSERPIRGSHDWQRYALEMDVPADALTISIGVHLAGSGQVWLDDVRFEAVGSDVPANR